MKPGTTLQAVFDSMPIDGEIRQGRQTKFKFIRRSAVVVVAHKDHVEFTASGCEAIRHMITHFGQPNHRTGIYPAWMIQRTE